MDQEALPLEDTFGDDLRKAMIGNRIDATALAGATGIAQSAIAAWLKDDGTANEADARALAGVLHLDAGKFADTAAGRWYPPEVAPPNVTRHAQRPHPSNGFVVLADDGRAALVDPAGTPGNLLRRLSSGRYDLQYVLITHRHADHCDAAAAVAAAYPGAQIVMHPLDADALGASLATRIVPIVDGRELAFGSGSVRTLHTPGHTDGSSCFLAGTTLFTGDTLFAGSVGGAYAKTATYADILTSIREKIFTLPDATAVMPGHGPNTTIALEKRHNPFFPSA